MEAAEFLGRNPELTAINHWPVAITTHGVNVTTGPLKMTVWEDGGITHPCGHESSFEDGCHATDRFACPRCGLRWKIETGPPIIYPSGYIITGKRMVMKDAQGNLPLLFKQSA